MSTAIGYTPNVLQASFVTRADRDYYMQRGDPLEALGTVPAKRAATWGLYHDLLEAGRKRILDVGAGDGPLSELLAARHDYTVCELPDDWRAWPRLNYDLIIANDLFPNVDQGLRGFLARFLGLGELRLSLTIRADRWYRVRRLDGDEILTMVAWDWKQTAGVLAEFGIDLAITPPTETLFENGRQMCLLRLS